VQIELAYSYLGNRASLLILRLAYVAVYLKTTNRRFRRSGAVGNTALIASRNIKSIIKTTLISTSL
jgi:hypothetical protein